MPGVEIVFRLASAFKVSPNTLFGEIERNWRKEEEENASAVRREEPLNPTGKASGDPEPSVVRPL